jgi:hypothetical protein
VLAKQTAAQTWKSGQAVSLALGSAPFTDPQGETLTYSVKQASGAALPAWLKFNATTDTLTGTAPTSTQTLSLALTATDTSGLFASESFSASVVAGASRFAEAHALVSPRSSSATSSLTAFASASTIPSLVAAYH